MCLTFCNYFIKLHKVLHFTWTLLFQVTLRYADLERDTEANKNIYVSAQFIFSSVAEVYLFCVSGLSYIQS